MKSNLSRENLLLFIIYKAESKGLTPAQLQKSLFLLEKAFPKKLTNFYKFEPYNYGPFDSAIYEDADLLTIKNYVKQIKVNDYDWSIYHITQKGKEKALEIEKKLPKDMSNYIYKLVRWIQNLTFQELISAIYKKYPEYKVNSVFSS